MGRNFYKVLRVDRLFSFSLANGMDVYDWLSDQGYLEGLNDQGAGMIDVPVAALEKMLREIELGDKKVLKEIKEDIRQAKNARMEIITYEVF